MTIDELLEYRSEKLEFIQDEEGFYSEESFARECAYFMNQAKLLDTDEYNDCYYESNSQDGIKINGYLFNDSMERLQIFVVNFPTNAASSDDFVITKKDYYSTILNLSQRIIIAALQGKDVMMNDSEPIRPLINKLSSKSGLEQIDTIELFLLSNTISADPRGGKVTPKHFPFEPEDIQIKSSIHSIDKAINFQKRVIDINFLHTVETSKEPREPVEIHFSGNFGESIACLKASEEIHYASYLAVIPATTLCAIYGKYSNRILEKNVRAFLQFRGKVSKTGGDLKGGNPNARMRYTIRETPERFLAYNNGLTITASNAEILENNGQLYINSLYDFQIINGGQTTASLYFAQKEGIAIDKVKVTAKINILNTDSVEELEDLIKNISISSNYQTKVTSVDLTTRNKHLQQIKVLSEQCTAPNGNKWFFEKSKGEFYILLHKDNSAAKRMYDKDRKLTKEQLAKFYVSWGDTPYLVKKGGEKVYKDFISLIEKQFPDETTMQPIFFENLIGQTILFNTFHKLYGERSNAIGQIRSATVPYTLGIIYHYAKQGDISTFNLNKIWVDQKLSQKFQDFVYRLMSEVNASIIRNKLGDDVNEDTKKEPLWNKVKIDTTIEDFFLKAESKSAMKEYYVSTDETLKQLNVNLSTNDNKITSLELNAISDWAKYNDVINSVERKYLMDMSKHLSKGRGLSSKQEKEIFKLIDIVKNNGFQFVE